MWQNALFNDICVGEHVCLWRGNNYSMTHFRSHIYMCADCFCSSSLSLALSPTHTTHTHKPYQGQSKLFNMTNGSISILLVSWQNILTSSTGAVSEKQYQFITHFTKKLWKLELLEQISEGTEIIHSNKHSSGQADDYTLASERSLFVLAVYFFVCDFYIKTIG